MPAEAHRVKPGEVSTPEASAAETVPFKEQVAQTFAFGKKVTVRTRDGQEHEIEVNPFYIDQLWPVIDQVEKIYAFVNSMADKDSGEVDLMEVFKAAKEDVLLLLAAAIEKDRKWVGSLYIDGAVELFAAVFAQNKDFFEQRVKTSLQQVFGQISSML